MEAHFPLEGSLICKGGKAVSIRIMTRDEYQRREGEGCYRKKKKMPSGRIRITRKGEVPFYFSFTQWG